jgi:hypothetical protein
VVIRGQATPTLCGGERPVGSRVNGKRMAAVGSVYSRFLVPRHTPRPEAQARVTFSLACASGWQDKVLSVHL